VSGLCGLELWLNEAGLGSSPEAQTVVDFDSRSRQAAQVGLDCHKSYVGWAFLDRARI